MKKQINDWTKQNLKGMVKSVTEIEYKAVKGLLGVTKGEIEKTEITYFTPNGFQIERTNDDKSTIVLGAGEKRIKKYDDMDNLIEYTVYNPDKSLQSKTIHSYDLNGNEIESNYYNKSGILTVRSINELDANGNKVAITNFDPNGRFIGKKTFKYDTNGKMIEEIETDGDSKTYKYNDDGNLIEEINKDRYNNDKTTYLYDDMRNVIEENTYCLDGKLKRKYSFKTDNMGNMLETILYNGDGSQHYKYTHEYVYDKFQNWIEQITYYDNSPFTIIEREIVYFEPNSAD